MAEMTLFKYLVNRLTKSKQRKEQAPVIKETNANELRYKVGSFLRLESFGTTQTKEIVDIKNHVLRIDDKCFLFSDYFLSPGDLKIRAFDENRDAVDDNCWLLSRFDQFPFSHEFRELLDGPVLKVDEISGDEFSRPDGVRGPYLLPKMSYWDYYRLGQDEAGSTFTEWLLVEMDTTTGEFTIWLGYQIPRLSLTNF